MKCCKFHQRCMPQRVFVCLMAFLGLTISNMMRFAISLCLTFIALPRPKSTKKTDCNIESSEKTSKSVVLFEWDEFVQAKILSAFFVGYIITQLPAGIISDLFGPRRVVFWSGLITSLITLLTGPITRLADWPGLVALRVLLGLAQGAFYAALHAVCAVWVPTEERGVLGSFVFIGAHAGNFGSVTITGFILDAVGPYRWDWLFYIYGAIGLVWSIFFFFMTYDTYLQFPEGVVKEKEKAKLDAYFSSSHNKTRVKFTEMPWHLIMTNLPVYALIVALWGHCWGLFIMINNVPKFMASVLGFNVRSNGLYLGGAYVLMLIVAFASGYLVDWLVRNNKIPLTWNRVIFTSIASVLPSLGFLGLTYCECDGVCAFVCLTIGMGAMGTFYPSLKVNGIDLSSNYGGTVGSMSHWLGTTAGAAGPPIVASLAPESTIAQYRVVMWLTFVLLSVTNLFYVLFASANAQKFNFYNPPGKKGPEA